MTRQESREAHVGGGKAIEKHKPDKARGKQPVLSVEENPGGGSLEGTENPGGAKV